MTLAETGVRHHKGPRPEGQRETARRLRREGMTVTQIADKLSVPRSTVGVWVRGLERPRACLLCGEPARGTFGNFCSRAHGEKYYRVFKRRAA